MADRFVATTGNDTTGNGTQALPWATFKRAIEASSPGDVIHIRGGIYTQAFNSSSIAFPSPSGWGSPIIIESHENEVVELRVSGMAIQIAANRGYYWFRSGTPGNKNFKINGLNAGTAHLVRLASGCHHIRMQDMELFNSQNPGTTNGQCIHTVPPSGVSNHKSFHEFLGLLIHDIGPTGTLSNQYHGLYLRTGGNLLDGLEIYNINDGGGVQFYNTADATNAADNVLRNSLIYDCHSGLYAEGFGHQIYNNIFNNLAVTGIYISNSQAPNPKPDQNILFAHNIVRLSAVRPIRLTSSARDIRIFNNILFGNSPNNTVNATAGATYSTHPSGGSDTNLYSNPLWVNPGGGDFHLQAGSPAVDSAVVLVAVPTDYEGNVRPAGGAPDQGPFEFAGVPDPDPDPEPDPGGGPVGPIIWVRPSMGDDENDGLTKDTAVETFAAAWAVAAPGSLIILGWDEIIEESLVIDKQGTSFDPGDAITIQAEPPQPSGVRPIVRPASGVNVIRFEGAEYVVVAGIRFDGVNVSGDAVHIQDDCSHLRFDRVQARTAGRDGFHVLAPDCTFIQGDGNGNARDGMRILADDTALIGGQAPGGRLEFRGNGRHGVLVDAEEGEGEAAASVENSGSFNQTSAGTSHAIAGFNVPVGDKRFLALLSFHRGSSNTQVTAAARDGQSLSIRTVVAPDVGDGADVQIHHLIGPNTGAVDLSMTTTSQTPFMVGVALSGIAQTDPIRDSDSASGSGTTASLTLDTEPGDIVIGGCVLSAGGSANPQNASGQTPLVDDQTIGTGAGKAAAAGYKIAVGASTTIGFDLNSGNWGISAIALKNDGTAGGPGISAARVFARFISCSENGGAGVMNKGEDTKVQVSVIDRNDGGGIVSETPVLIERVTSVRNGTGGTGYGVHIQDGAGSVIRGVAAWDNAQGEIQDDGTSTVLEDNYTGAEDPFEDVDAFDFHPAEGSGLVDGLEAALEDELSDYNNREIQGAAPDIGALESLFTTEEPPDPPPTIAGLTPALGRKGATIPITITGTGFEAGSAALQITDLDALPSGIAVENLVVVDDAEITADLVISPGTHMGLRSIRVVTEDGTSLEEALFTVFDMRLLSEIQEVIGYA